MAYIDVLRSGNVDLLKQLSDTALGNMKNVFKGIPAVPEYVADGEKIGDWELRYQKPRNAIGYFFPVSMSHGGIALLKDGKTWMSLTPLELESHMLPINAAKGACCCRRLGVGDDYP